MRADAVQNLYQQALRPCGAGLSVEGMSDGHRLMLRNDPSTIDALGMTMRSGAITLRSVDEKTRSVEFVMATEAPTLVYDWRRGQVVEEVLLMSGVDLPATRQVTMLSDHWPRSIANCRGSLRDMRVDGDKLIGRAYFATDDDSEIAWQKVRDGHVTDLSVGYAPDESSQVLIEAGASAQVSGRTFTASNGRSLLITQRWKPKEGSLVVIGADEFAKVRAAHSKTQPPAPTPKDTPMKLEDLIIKFGEKHRSLITSMFNSKCTEDAIRAAVEAVDQQQRAAVPAPAPAPAADAGNEAGRAIELARVREINALAGDDCPPDLLKRALNEGWNKDRFTSELLNHVRSSRGAPIATGPAGGSQAGATAQPADEFARSYGQGEPGRDLLVRSMSLELGRRSGLTSERVNKIAVNGRLVDDAKALGDSYRWGGIGLKEMARVCLRHAGQECIGISDEKLLERAISTFTFPEILGAGMQKVLLAAYEEEAAIAMQWTGEEEVADFKTVNALRMGKFSSLAEVGEGGELESGTLEEGKETMGVKTYGRFFTITRKQFINDDLGAFARIPFELAVLSNRNIDDLSIALLAQNSDMGPTMGDTVTLFKGGGTRADGNNYQEGAATVLGEAGLGTAKTLLRKTKDGAATLNIVPEFLLVPADLETAAKKLINSIETRNTTANTVEGTSNPHYQSLRVVVMPQLASLTVAPTTNWYLGGNPNRYKTIVRVYLRGRKAPTLERSDPTSVLGFGWRFYHDVGVRAIGWRGIVRSKGAA